VIEPSYKIYLLGKYCSANLVKDPQIELENSGHGMIRSLFEWTKSLSALMKRIFVGEAGVLAKGLILGGSSAFSAETIADLRRSGTSHLVAVSGYNVTIITVQLFKLLRNTVSRRIAFIVTIVFLLAFCVMTGMSASIMRATIFGLLFLVGKMLGRRSAAINALLVAAFLMILINPYILWDVGFQLSFAATFGLVVGGWIFPATSAGGWISSLKSVLQETIFAQIFTLPIILTAFGQVSLLAPVANLLILPLVPTEMLLLGITLATGLISFWAGVFLASVSKVLLDYFLIVIKFIGGLSFAAMSVDQFSALAAVGLYLIIWAGYVYLKRIIDVRQATK